MYVFVLALILPCVINNTGPMLAMLKIKQVGDEGGEECWRVLQMCGTYFMFFWLPRHLRNVFNKKSPI
jgi:hypothetical protein